MVLYKRRDNLFRRWVLGFGSGELTVKAGGPKPQTIEQPSVIFAEPTRPGSTVVPGVDRWVRAGPESTRAGHLLSTTEAVFEEQFLLDLGAIDRLATEGHDKLAARSTAEAAGKFRQTLTLDPYHPAALDGLIQACERLGQPEAAQGYRNRAERLRRRTGA